MSYGYPTTRRFARSTNEAFQQDQGDWWFPPKRNGSERIWFWASVIFFISTCFYVASLK